MHKLKIPTELLGTMSDAELGRQLGVSRQVVYNHRVAARIPAWDPLVALAQFVRGRGPTWTWNEVAAHFGYLNGLVARRSFQAMGHRRGVRVPDRDVPVTARRGVGPKAYLLRQGGMDWAQISQELGVQNACSSAKVWAQRVGQPWPPKKEMP